MLDAIFCLIARDATTLQSQSISIPQMYILDSGARHTAWLLAHLCCRIANLLFASSRH